MRGKEDKQHGSMDVWVLEPGWGFKEERETEAAAIEATFGKRHGHLVGEIPAGSIVVPRFRALPFGQELNEEVELHGSQLLNGWAGHRYAASLPAWYHDLKHLTAETWFRAEDIPWDENGPFVVKGETNSRRQLWHTHCYAENRQKLGQVIANLSQDSLIGHQQLCIRKFLNLNVLGVDIVGMPIGEEYRVFYLDGKELARGFYWVNHLEDLDKTKMFGMAALNEKVLEEAGQICAEHIRFSAVDYGFLETGETVVIEVNDGCMAGLCGVGPAEMWTNLYEGLCE